MKRGSARANSPPFLHMTTTERTKCTTPLYYIANRCAHQSHTTTNTRDGDTKFLPTSTPTGRESHQRKQHYETKQSSHEQWVNVPHPTPAQRAKRASHSSSDRKGLTIPVTIWTSGSYPEQRDKWRSYGEHYAYTKCVLSELSNQS